MKFDHITHIVLLGAFGQFEAFSQSALDAGFGVDIVTSPDQAGEFKTSLPTLIVEKLSDNAVADRLNAISKPSERLAISFGARWFMKQPIREKLFNDQVLNAHGARLPMDQGGGGFCWRIMRGDRFGNLVLHRVNDGLDTGDLIANEEYILSPHRRTPADFIADYAERLPAFMAKFFAEAKAGRDFTETPQPDYYGAYLPRLHTKTHGWIDWTLNALDLERFILAFDDPYPGAMTTWQGQTIHLKSCQMTAGDTVWHPWQSGLVVRNEKSFLTVCIASGETMIVERVSDEDGNSLLSRIKVGDRLVTLSQELDDARNARVQFDASGKR